MEREPGRGEAERRRGRERRRGQDRRAGGSLGSRARFSLLYFVIAFLLLIGLNYLLGQQSSAEISYSELKARIAAGQVKEVSLGPQTIRAVVADSVRRPGVPQVWTAVRVPEDEQLIPLLEAKGVPYEGVAEGWLGRAMGWLPKE